MSYIGEANCKGVLIMVSRDEHGKFFISRNGLRTGVKLNASEMCRWLLNAMHEEVKHEIDDNMLRKQSDEFLKSGERIAAVKYCREHRDWRLKEAHDYVKLSEYY